MIDQQAWARAMARIAALEADLAKARREKMKAHKKVYEQRELLRWICAVHLFPCRRMSRRDLVEWRRAAARTNHDRRLAAATGQQQTHLEGTE